MFSLSIGFGLVCLAFFSTEMGLDSLVGRNNRPLTRALVRSLLLAVGVVLLIGNRTEFPFIQVWVPPWTWREVSYPMALAAFVLLATGLLPPSHLRMYVPESPWFGVVLWGVAHLLTNGDLASIIFFGAMVGLAGLKIFFAWKGRTVGIPRVDQKAKTADLSSVTVQSDIAAILLGLIGWGVIILFHGQLFGVGLDLLGY